MLLNERMDENGWRIAMLEAAIPFPKVSLLRRAFLGGSDARIIMGSDEAALLRLWREKRGEAEPTDYSGNLLVQLGLATEPLKSALVRARDWARHQRRPDLGSASRDPLDGGDPGRHRRGQWGRVRSEIHAPLVILRRGGRREAYAAGQHNMWVTNATAAVLSIITGGGKWVEIKISADPLYQHLLLTAEKKFWRCVESGEPASHLLQRGAATRPH